jgi:nicotinamide mononucleotide adenylyltransferase
MSPVLRLIGVSVTKSLSEFQLRLSPEQQSMLEASLQAKISEIEFIIKGIFNYRYDDEHFVLIKSYVPHFLGNLFQNCSK